MKTDNLIEIELISEAITEEEAQQVAAAADAAMSMELSRDAQIFIMITTDEDVHKLNKEHRNVDAPTDVLSFPANDLDKPLAQKMEEGFEPEFDECENVIVLGDIVISADTAARQAEEYGNTLIEELRFLAVHGALHLLGYDHMVAEDEMLMRQKQRIALGREEA